MTLPLTDLPVEDGVPAVRAALADPGAALLQAEPGAGKTTVVPLRLLDEPWMAGRRMLLLEPRRIAARAAARRMADLLGEPVGATVGYRTRDERVVGPRTRIEVVTEGILTRRLQRDPSLDGVALVVFDEFHERSLPGDLGLALALESRSALRPDLRLLVMSATLDVARVAALLGGASGPAPVVSSPGRAHPVDIRWRPKGQRDRLERSVVGAVREALRDTDGDVLVFLPGVAEIRRAEEALADVVDPGVDVLPLHGSLPAAAQDAAIGPSAAGRRKVVLSTDIAETSLTVTGVRAVVDAGLARVPRFDARSGMTRLTTVSASRASAEQRAGRAGRLAPGIAIRLWSKVEQAARRPFADPEIAQADLAGLALELAVWGTGDPTALPFLDPPPPRAAEEGRRLLHELGALADGRVTALGRAMAELPLHPRLARMVVVAVEERRGWTACLLAALLEDRDVLRGAPDERSADVASRLALLADPGARHPLADGRALRQARTRAEALADRVGVTDRTADPAGAGGVLSLAYPDRLARRRERSRGRFVLRGGGGAWVPATDPLADEPFLVAADLDGHRTEARIRLAAPLDEFELVARFHEELEERTTVAWDRERDDLVARVERRLGALRLDGMEGPPDPGPATVGALVARVRSVGLGLLGPDDGVRRLQARLAFLRTRRGDEWPDASDAELLATLDDWLAPRLVGARGRADLERIDLVEVLTSRLDETQRRALERLAPAHVALPRGRRVALDYDHDPPLLSVRVQELYGTTEGPRVLGGELPVVLELLSPADRPIQRTSDLAGFWAGSWRDVRKDMAGRYPKHDWPADPAAAPPRSR
jgi:ATP-dependent helicase HrpB